MGPVPPRKLQSLPRLPRGSRPHSAEQSHCQPAWIPGLWVCYIHLTLLRKIVWSLMMLACVLAFFLTLHNFHQIHSLLLHSLNSITKNHISLIITTSKRWNDLHLHIRDQNAHRHHQYHRTTATIITVVTILIISTITMASIVILTIIPANSNAVSSPSTLPSFPFLSL